MYIAQEQKLSMSIHVELRIIPELSRCSVYMLSQILYDKTQDVGKIGRHLLHKISVSINQRSSKESYISFCYDIKDKGAVDKALFL